MAGPQGERGHLDQQVANNVGINGLSRHKKLENN